MCTIIGSTRRHGVGEVRMGTPLREVIEAIGGGPKEGRRIKAVMSGVANGVIPGSLIDTPVTYEDLAAIGSGIGSAGFVVLDDTVDMAAIAAGVARFLAVESCGQCSPCKLDGLTLADRLSKVSNSDGDTHDYDVIRHRLRTVSERSRCFLATQQEVVVGSIVKHFGDELEAHIAGTAKPADAELVAELLDIRGGQALIDARHQQKQPDWSFNERDSGTVPVELYSNLAPPWRPDRVGGR